MRLAALALAASLLALAGCGKQEAAGNAASIDETVTAEDFATNDVTAIDAAFGADANMAADVDINFVDPAAEESGGNGSASAGPRPARPRPSAPANNSDATDEADSEPAAPAAPAASNSTTNSN